MAKTNRVCYCCGNGYYYCPSCPGDNRDPQIYTMFDSEQCKNIFNILVSESTKKITTKECKEKLIEMNINSYLSNKNGVVSHINRVMEYTDITNDKMEINEQNEFPTVDDKIEMVEKIKVQPKFRKKYDKNSEAN